MMSTRGGLPKVSWLPDLAADLDDDENEDECELDMETMQPLDPSKCLQ